MEKMTDSIQHTLKQFAADSALTTTTPLCSDIPLFDINALVIGRIWVHRCQQSLLSCSPVFCIASMMSIS